MTTKLVEPYSTSTGQSTQVGFEETTETVSTVSIKTQCSSSETDCEEWSSTTCTAEVGSEIAASGKTIPQGPSTSQGYTQPPEYLSTPEISHSWITSVTHFPVSSGSVATGETLSTSSAGDDEKGDARTMKAGGTSVSTAGAAVTTAGVGLGALFGIIIAMA